MVSVKDRLEDVETNMGSMQDEIQKFNGEISEKFRIMENSFHRLAEENRESINRLITMMSGNQEGGSNNSPVSHPNPNAPSTQHGPPATGTHHAPALNRHVKLDLPRFDGGDPTEWLSKAKQYFAYQDIPDHQQVSLATYHLTAEANEWWQATSKTLGTDARNTAWHTFEAELWVRFGPTQAQRFHETLSKIRQTGSLGDYQREFEQLRNKVHNWSEEALIGTFLGGLNPSIAAQVRMFSPTTLKEVITLARLSNEQLQLPRKIFPQRNHTSHPSPTTTNPQASTQTPKKLSWEEMRRKRSLGLCFSCDERYVPGHKCKTSQLLLMLGEDDEEDDTDEEIFHDVDDAEITLHALTGWDSPTTLRAEIVINKRRLVALIDSGSTHNFINERIANPLNLKMAHTKPFNVRVADGHPLRCKGVYRDIATQIGGAIFPIDFFALPLSGLDVVLGVQWAHSDEITREAKQASLALSIQSTKHSPIVIVDDLRQVITEFDEIFKIPSELPPSRAIEHHITLKEGSDPVNVRPYRYAHFQKAEIESQVTEMLSSGLIRPSSSPFSSPVLLVKKKDGSWRFCTDYRALNKATIKDRFPIPTVDDMLDELHGASIFTKLDLTAGYHQVRVHPPDIPKTAFRTHNGHYEYLVMPFGLCNAPSTFQSLMNSVFRDHLRKFVLVFFDDILVYSKSRQEHLIHVREVLRLLQQHRLFVKLKKCEFGKQELEYLGHIISGDGVKVDQSKIQAMTAWPSPTTITELRGFLGLTGYYRKFVQHYGIIARPLTNLLKKGKFEWTGADEEAFNHLKSALTTTPILALPDFSSPFIIQTDASGDGIRAILSQQGRPIAYMSRSLGVAKRSWSTYAREMLAIVIAIRTWRPYLLGRRFIIQSDQRSLRFMLEQRILTPLLTETT
ncbi:unnamed protein product [Microthlaspi erraticum]|uniref:Reverse transcriptase domain-containing protein n=1 Tax=Microthlaspi erraticum TaxID=1685480 RepID=A0A6D2KTY6_9BRAS|nr:unnamed protein product [Microthlaspi erraticum]